MSSPEIATAWAEHFGLALTPFFDGADARRDGEHVVLLDGGFGSFALSLTNEELWKSKSDVDSWAWSSNLPHHVTVTDKVVAVSRWDREKVDVLSRRSVESQADSFYSYLVSDRVRSSQRVIEYTLALFRRVRSLVAAAHIDDIQSVAAFLALLSHLVQQDQGRYPAASHPQPTPGFDMDLLRSLSASGVEAMIEHINNPDSAEAIRLFPSLAIRHAGSEIFQEAHFEFLRAPGLDLFGWTGPAEVKAATRGGAHFTPPALARSVVEQTLDQVENLDSRQSITVLDPACGSGAFLHEALRALRRLNFKGRLLLVGRDVSPAATSMAAFVVGQASTDWSPPGGILLDIQCGDSLSSPLPDADVVLTNPPFIAWPALDSRQKETMKEVLGSRLQGRGDLSMAFVTRALDITRPGGAVGVLLPSSLLTLQAAEAWRRHLLERSDLRMLASLGEYGLFSHALVQVTAAIFAVPSNGIRRTETVTALVTANSADATGNALRSLRRSKRTISDTYQSNEWRLFSLPVSTLRERSTWRLTSPRVEAALLGTLENGASRLGELFDVRQGVRTGDNAAFLLDNDQLASLPQRERKYFRRAVVNESIQDGYIKPMYWLFYPYSEDGALFSDEQALFAAVPKYAKQFLIPRQEILSNRHGVKGADRPDWWSLSRARASSWGFHSGPRLVSKYFGSSGGFAVDLKGDYVVVQGFAWFPKWASSAHPADDELPLQDMLHAYCALMNSQRFTNVLELFAPHVAGGQFDLSPRYISSIPVPNLAVLSSDERWGRKIAQLASLGRNPRPTEVEWLALTDRLTADLYGIDFSELI